MTGKVENNICYRLTFYHAEKLMIPVITPIVLAYMFMTALVAVLIMAPWGVFRKILGLPDEEEVNILEVPHLGTAFFLAFLLTIMVSVEMSQGMHGVLAGVLIILVTGVRFDFHGISSQRMFFGELCAVLTALAVANLYDIYDSLANRQKKSIELQIFSLFGVSLVLLISSYVTWQVITFWDVEEAWPLLVTTAIASSSSLWIFSNLRQLPLGSRFQSIVDSVTFPFVAEVILLLCTGWFYSSAFLAVSFAGVILLLCIYEQIFLKKNIQRLAAMPGRMMDDLYAGHGKGWTLFHSPDRLICCEVAVAGYPHKSHQERTGFLSQSSSSELSSELPVCSAGTLYEICTGRISLNNLNIEGDQEFKPSYIYGSVKELMDTVLVLLSLPVTIPVMMIVALAVRLDSPGPVFFRQERVGQHGNNFMMWKFRSMRIDSEANGAQFASKNDSRVTRVGKFIRKFRFDELPQFWNVIKGDMSLIGPRPEQEAFVRDFEREIPSYSCRHLVKPGITGWAQVSQGYAASQDETREKLEFDLFYAKHFSFWLDLCIIRKTVFTILTGFGSR